MKKLFTFVCLLGLLTTSLSQTHCAEPKVVLEEAFDTPLSKDWHWGLGTWTSENGVLRGFESGPRRHGPVKVRKFPFTDATIEFEFRLDGRASFAGIVFNGDQSRGHIVHFYATRKDVHLTAHPSKGEKVEVIKEPLVVASEEWHQVRIKFKGEQLSAELDGKKYEASLPCFAERKEAFGLGGDSGGPEGEKAGSLLFRKLKISEGL